MFDISARIRVIAENNDHRYDGDSVWAKVERVNAPFSNTTNAMPSDGSPSSDSRGEYADEKPETILGFVQGLFRRAA